MFVANINVEKAVGLSLVIQVEFYKSTNSFSSFQFFVYSHAYKFAYLTLVCGGDVFIRA